MHNPVIRSIAAGVRGQCYRQDEIFQILRPYFNQNPRAEVIFQNAGVGSRYLAVAGEYYQEERSTQARNERYMEEAMLIGEQVIAEGLRKAGAGLEDVGDLIIVSCTGIDTPGLDLRLAGKMGLPPDLRRACLLGMGCYGAFPGLLRGSEAVLARPDRLAVVLCVEICSLHFQPGDQSIENVVSSALFADGAAAAVIGMMPGSRPAPRLIDSATYCDYQTFDHMAFHLTDHGFRMSLSAYVPRLLAAQIEEFVDHLLARNHLSRDQIRHWGVHPGSAKILDFVQERLGLADDDLAASRKVLYEYGNMSSATILFVLDEIIRTRQPAPDEYGVIMSFGPGLTMEAALIQWGAGS